MPVIMSIRRIKTADDNAIIGMAFCLNIFFVVESHCHMRDALAAEEDQVALLHLLTRYGVNKYIVLLIGIARNNVAAHPIAKLDKTAAIDAFPARSSP